MTIAITHLERLVGFATVSRDSNLGLIEYVRAELAELGIESELVASDDGRKANLFATIGPPGQPGVVLSGHTDVVPCEGQAWTTDPFTVRRDNGRLYGRGTADMKGFIACCLAMARQAVGRDLATPIHLAFSYDEEVGCIGVRRLLDMLAALPVKPRFCIVGEPTLMQVATAHKGKASWRVVAHGLEAHSSLAPNGVNAIHLAVDLIGCIRAIQDELATAEGHDGAYDVPYSTLHVGRISGGETINIVPNRASFDFELRYLPRDDADALYHRIEAAAAEIAERAQSPVRRGETGI
jgi:acetylornithine deacetylase